MDIANLAISVRTNGVTQATRDLDRLEKKTGVVEREANKLGITWGKVAGVITAAGIGTATRAWIRQSDVFAQLTGRLGLYVKEQAALLATQDRLFDLAQRTGGELQTVTELYTKLAGASANLRNNQADLLRTTELVNKALVISGADANASAAVIRQFAQALAAGALRGDEFVSVMEGAPRLAQAIADGLQVPIGKLREMASEGELTADKVTGALLRSGQAIDNEFKRMPLTVGRATQEVRNALLQLIGKTDQAAGASRGLADAISDVARALSNPQTQAAFRDTATALARIAAGALDAIGALREYFAENDQKSRASLQNLLNDKESELFAIERQNRGSLSFLRRDTSPLKAEIAEIERLLDARTREARGNDRAGVEVTGRTSKAGKGIWANINAEGATATKETSTRKLAAATRELTEAQKAYNEQEEVYALIVEETEQFRRDRVAQAYQEALATDERMRQNDAFVQSLGEELALLQMTAAEREREIALRHLSADATDEQRAAVSELADALRRASEQTAFMDDFRQNAVGTLRDFVTGAESATDALRGFFDTLADYITRMIAERWIEQAFGSFGSTGSGTKGGDIIGGLFDLFSSSGWGGLSEGGYTGPGGKYEPAGVVHKGEVVWSQADIRRAGGVAVVEGMRRGLTGYADGGVVGSRVTGAGVGSRSLHVEVNLTNKGGEPLEAQQQGTRMDGNKVIVDMVLGAVKSGIQQGKLDGDFGRAFGLRRMGVSRG